MAKLIDIEGIGETYAKRLHKAGVTSTSNLLEKGASSAGRKDIAEKSGIGEHLILEWVNRIDLYRINGVGSEYSDLLEASGVDTVIELGKRNAANLYNKIIEVNNAKNKVRKLPTLGQVEDWFAQSKTLPRVISY